MYFQFYNYSSITLQIPYLCTLYMKHPEKRKVDLGHSSLVFLHQLIEVFLVLLHSGLQVIFLSLQAAQLLLQLTGRKQIKNICKWINPVALSLCQTKVDSSWFSNLNQNILNYR